MKKAKNIKTAHNSNKYIVPKGTKTIILPASFFPTNTWCYDIADEIYILKNSKGEALFHLNRKMLEGLLSFMDNWEFEK